MNNIILKLPNFEYEINANEFKDEFFKNNEKIINGSCLFDQMNFNEWLEHKKKNSNPDTAASDWSISDTFFAVRRNTKRIIGIIDVRHSLKNDFLKNYGGHIGFAVRPSERRKGYATRMLLLALEHAKSLGIKKVMLGCYSNNIASIKTITKCGGILSETKKYIDGNPMNIYWIENIN